MHICLRRMSPQVSVMPVRWWSCTAACTTSSSWPGLSSTCPTASRRSCRGRTVTTRGTRVSKNSKPQALWKAFRVSWSVFLCFPADACVLFDHQNQTANGSSLLENATSPVIEFWEWVEKRWKVVRGIDDASQDPWPCWALTCVFSRREVLRLSNSLDGLGPISWKLALCLAVVWLICYFCVWKGVKSTGKVSRKWTNHQAVWYQQQVEAFETQVFVIFCYRTKRLMTLQQSKALIK